jgi:hypothetical protein
MTRKYVTWDFDETTIARVKVIADRHWVRVGDLADWLITLGLDQIEAGAIEIHTHENTRYKRLLDRGDKLGPS